MYKSLIKMRDYLLTALFLLLLSVGANAQEIRGYCATEGEAILPRLLENKKAMEDNEISFRETVYVPVTWHRIGKNDGSGKVTMVKILEQMCGLNESFAAVGMQFYIKNINDINSTNIYNDHRIAVNGVFRNQKDQNALNLFIPNNADINGDLGTTLGYYDPPQDWLVVRRDEINDYSVTLAHEVGHFFSLQHTFWGWDGEPYNPEEYPNHVDSDGNTARISPGGRITEFQDGTNCETAGDRICDTPPDYNFGFSYPSCNYTENVNDPQGEQVDPMENNMMSYFLNCGDTYQFTPMQQQIMLEDFMSSKRNPMRSNYVPQVADLGQPELNTPEDLAITDNFDEVELKWSAEAGATNYLLEIDRLPTFAIRPIRIVTEGTSHTILEGLEPGKKYYWRVRAYSDGNTCAQPTPARAFVTSTVSSVPTITEIEFLSVFPNPVRNAAVLNLQLMATESFEAQVNLYNITGQVVRSIGTQQIRRGENNFNVETQGLTNGVYTLTLLSEKGVLTRRVIINF